MKKNLLLLGAFLAVGTTLTAQELKEGYVKFPASDKLHEYVSAWNGGAGTISVDGSVWEDEEFFTSRVKPRGRVTHTGADIYNFGDKAGRRSLWWVPIGLPATQALPNGRFDSEVFSMWSYLDHYGTWTAPFGWSVGAMSDIAHKNGVAVSGVASIPNSAIPSNWSSCLSGVSSNYNSDTKVEKLGKFLYYHGCNGLGYNSEFSSSSSLISNIMATHNALYKWMAGKDDIFENIWYDGTNESGGISFDSALNGKTNIYKSSSVFSNYNWTGLLGTGQSRAEQVNDVNGTARGPWWQYAGMDQQGGQPKGGDNYPNVNNYKWSLGWWGAHSSNMFWESRNGGGSGEDRMLTHYLKVTETFFGNGLRNPAIHLPIKTVRAHRPSDQFHGVSAQINERSAITHQISTEPFYTYFNLGNGKFFNWKGERVSNNKWYSIGVQDYMPTWRFWFAPEWLQKEVPQDYRKLDASFTWEDAYFGGSCLKIEGTADKEYLHLFKTQIKPVASTLTVRYKLLEGEADIRVVITGTTKCNEETDMWKDINICSVEESPTLQDISYREGADGWVEKTYNIIAKHCTTANLNGGNIGVIGLEFKNAKNMKLLLGEFSIMKKANMPTPAAPAVKSSKVLGNVFEGIDGKIIWTMDGDAARNAGTPLYNSDVNVSMFKVYAQEEGGPETFVGTTTSWAAVAFQAPNTDNNKKIRFGVSAVSLDTRTESAISWGNYLAKGTYTPSEEVVINKSIIKPNEGFVVSYKDPQHSSSTWKIKNSEGTVMASGSGTSISVPNGFANEGGYDLVIDEGTTKARTLGYFVQVTSEKVGAVPEIKSIAINGQDAKNMDVLKINTTDKPVISYTGRSCDGSASRSLALNSRYIGSPSTEVGLSNGNESFSIAGWFYFREMPTQTWNFMNVSNKKASWPQNTWGWAWNHGDPSGNVYCTFRGAQSDTSSPGELHYEYSTGLKAGVWTHIAWICEYGSQGFQNRLYLNGVRQMPDRVFRYDKGGPYKNDNLTQYGNGNTWWPIQSGQVMVSSADYFYFGGAAHGGQAVDGYVDDFQVWKKAMTEDEVKASLRGLDGNNLPSAVAAFWDFEGAPNADNSFSAKGQMAGAKGYSYDIDFIDGNPEKGGDYAIKEPMFMPGCPFLTGTAFPVKTVAEWKDLSDRKTVFTKGGARAAADDEGAGGSATVEFKTGGDHNIQLSLTNDYGTATTGKDDAADFTFPVIEVPETMGIDGVDADGADVVTSVEGRVVYLSYAGEGTYAIEAYNTAGMLVASEAVNAVAGGTSELTFAAPGVYLVKVVKNGVVLRTIKVAVR